MTVLHAISVWIPCCSGLFGRVCRTQLANRTSELLLVEDAPINDIMFDSHSSALWVATASSSVKRYSHSTVHARFRHKLYNAWLPDDPQTHPLVSSPCPHLLHFAPVPGISHSAAALSMLLQQDTLHAVHRTASLASPCQTAVSAVSMS